MKKNLFFMMLIFTMLVFAKGSTQTDNDTDKYNPYDKKIISNKSNKDNLSILDEPKKISRNNDSNATPAKKITANTGMNSHINFSLLSHVTSNFQSTYAIQKEDTLGSISSKFAVAQGEIKQLNPYFNFNNLTVGAELIMPLSQDKINMILKSLENAKIAKAKEYKEEYRIISEPDGHQLRVIATAYTSHVAQSDNNPFEAAWGYHLSPGMKAIAISRDLIIEYGLTNGSKVKIGGLDGYYIVRDKMNKRFTERIDIYMGLDIQKALRWGKRSVMIYW